VSRRIRVEEVIPAPIGVVWADIARLDTHVEWMADAESIEFLGDQDQGAGTRMKVATRIGPLRTSDVMEFTAWEPPHRMAIRHEGLVSGAGEFRLSSIDDASTRFVWEEELDFPLHFGGRLGETVGAPILAWVWRRNLRALAARFA
jgi:carbon monoxide dehydrogenase subunit G